MSTTPCLNTKEVPFEEAQRRLQAFLDEYVKLIETHEVHCAILSVGMRLDVAATSGPGPGVLASGDLSGCVQHGTTFLARLLANALDPNAMNYFLQVLSVEVSERNLRDTTALHQQLRGTPPPSPTPPRITEVLAEDAIDEDALKNMPLPSEAKKWQQ